MDADLVRVVCWAGGENGIEKAATGYKLRDDSVRSIFRGTTVQPGRTTNDHHNFYCFFLSSPTCSLPTVNRLLHQRFLLELDFRPATPVSLQPARRSLHQAGLKMVLTYYGTTPR